MSAPMTPPERILAAFLHAWHETDPRTFVGGSVPRALRAVQGMTEEARAQGFLGAWDLTDTGRDLVARWQAEREAKIEERAIVVEDALQAAGVGLFVTHPSDGSNALKAVVRAVDASRDGAP